MPSARAPRRNRNRLRQCWDGGVAHWIDIGAPGGALEHRDTQRPTLNLSATRSGDAVTALHVGTVDLGSGVDPNSLEVCLLPDGACGTLLATEAHPHGIVRVNLPAPLNDAEQVVRARVSDHAG